MSVNTKNKVSIDISTSALIKILLVLLSVFLFWKVWPIIASLFLGIVVAAAIEPTIEWLEKQKIPRIISVPAIYILSMGTLLGTFYVFLPTLFNEVWLISQTLPDKYGNFLTTIFQTEAFGSLGFLAPALEELFITVQNKFAQLLPDIVGFISVIFGGLVSFFLVIIFSFYLSLRKKDLEKSLLAITPEKYKDDTKLILRGVQRRIGRWLQAMFVLATFIGVAVFIILSLLGVNFALTLGILAGILELVPYIGPFIAGAIILFVASSESLPIGLIALGLYIALQQLEQALVVPAVMSRVVGFNPLFIIIFVLIGAQLAGFWGILIAVPLAAAIAEVIRGINKTRKKAS